MCIVCNCDNKGIEFLDHFSQAKKKMKEASVLMLECSKVAKDIEAKKRYDKAHKKIVRIIKDWNKIEHERENCINSVHSMS